jgi:hypothetical protein
MHSSPVLALLRRLEAQNVWRMTYNVMPQQQFSTAVAQVDQVAGALQVLEQRCAGRMVVHHIYVI